MARYKVPQDVEAEDHLLGPLTPRQMFYALIVAVSVWLIILLAKKTITLILIPIPLFTALFFGLLIFLGIKNRSQPAELYLAAIVRFFFKPHKRVWDQEGAQQTVRITAPKREVHEYTDHLSRTEVRSRLSQLARLLDSRGWAAKSVSYQTAPIVLPAPKQNDDDERLVSLSQLPQIMEPQEVHAYDDRWDASASPVAQYFDEKITETQKRFKQEAIKRMRNPNYNPYPSIKQHVIQPLDSSASSSEPKQTYPQQEPRPAEPQTAPPPAPSKKQASLPPEKINQLVSEGAGNLSVSTISKEAERLQTLSDNQTVSLHDNYN